MVAENGEVTVFSATTDKPVTTWAGAARGAALTWSPDGKRIAGLSENQKLEIRDSSSGEVLNAMSFPPATVQYLGWLCDGLIERLVGHPMENSWLRDSLIN